MASARRAAGASERPWVRCAGGHPEHVGQRGVEVDAGGQRVAGRRRRSTPGQCTSSGMWPSGSYCGTPGLPQMSSPAAHVAEVVAVVGADDHGGVVPQALRRRAPPAPRRTSGRSSTAWRRSWPGCGGPRPRSDQAPAHAADGVRRPDEAVAVPRLVLVAADPRRRACRRARAGRTRRRRGASGRGAARPARSQSAAARHDPRAREVLLGAEERARPVVAPVDLDAGPAAAGRQNQPPSRPAAPASRPTLGSAWVRHGSPSWPRT